MKHDGWSTVAPTMSADAGGVERGGAVAVERPGQPVRSNVAAACVEIVVGEEAERTGGRLGQQRQERGVTRCVRAARLLGGASPESAK